MLFNRAVTLQTPLSDVHKTILSHCTTNLHFSVGVSSTEEATESLDQGYLLVQQLSVSEKPTINLVVNCTSSQASGYTILWTISIAPSPLSLMSYDNISFPPTQFRAHVPYIQYNWPVSESKVNKVLAVGEFHIRSKNQSLPLAT